MANYSTKEIARALTRPTTADQQKLKHLLRYINGPTNKTPTTEATITSRYSLTVPGQDVYKTTKSTAGFLIKVLGATSHYRSDTLAKLALSSAEAEL